MMTEKSDGCRAFPRTETYTHGGDSGMSLRVYAAIKLRVPDSGAPWLDEMIQKSNRDWLAGMALEFCLREFGGNSDDQTQYAEAAYQIADAMLKVGANDR